MEVTSADPSEQGCLWTPRCRGAGRGAVLIHGKEANCWLSSAWEGPGAEQCDASGDEFRQAPRIEQAEVMGNGSHWDVLAVPSGLS